MKPVTAFVLLTLIAAFFACTGNDVSKKKSANQDNLYFDYRIYGDEKDENITVYLQYLRGGKNGTSILLDDPAKVELDGEQLKDDRAELTGFYYEIEKPVGAFEGKHEIIFSDSNKKQYKEEFDFSLLKLKTNIPAEMSRGDLAFEFAGVQSNDLVRVVATDTSFRSHDINEIDTVKTGRIVIKTDQLRNLVNGPITLQFIKELERPVHNGTKAGGRLSISYGIQREFVLRN